ncbi:MAG: protoporphyrinogen oxidase, partial [Thermoanaerobaculia bacterium]
MPRVAIVGGGIAGLAAAHALVRSPGPAWGSGTRGPELAVTLVEAGERPGGKIATERLDGFLVEAGADSFGTRRPGALELVEDLGLSGEVLPTRGGRVLVLRDGRLEELPSGLHVVVPTDLPQVLASPLLSARGKLRVALDLLRLPPGNGRVPPEADEAVAPFLRRHFGAQYVERVAAPLLAGIHAADPERLSLRSAMAPLAMLERRHGSLVRGARRVARGGPARVGLDRGVGSLVEALARRLEGAGVEVLTGRAAVGVEPVGGGRDGSPPEAFRLRLAGGGALEAEAVVLATQPGQAASLVEPFAPGLAGSFRALPMTSTATVSLGFRRGDVRHSLDALGFLTPPGAGRVLRACTFASSKFPGRAPRGAVLVRAYLAAPSGAERAEGSLPEDDDRLVRLA